MHYVLLTLLILVVALLLLRFRVRLVLSKEQRTLFVGLGRSGVEIDFIADVTRIKLWGFTVKQARKEEGGEVPTEAGIAVRPVTVKAHAEKAKPKRKHRGSTSLMELLDVALRVFRAVRLFVVELIRSIIVEEAEAEIRAGFDSPDITGQLYGYYFALIGAVPALRGRLRFYPDWMGASFDGRGKLSLALPVYAFVYRTGLFLMRLPIMKIHKLYRGQRKGVAYAK